MVMKDIVSERFEGYEGENVKILEFAVNLVNLIKEWSYNWYWSKRNSKQKSKSEINDLYITWIQFINKHFNILIK